VAAQRLIGTLGFRVCLALALYFAGSPLSPTVKGAEDKNEQTVQTITLRDVQPLYGGQNLYLRGDGTGACQVVSRKQDGTGLHEKRFGVTVLTHVRRHLADLITNHSSFENSIKERLGLPDEARPTVFITLKSRRSLRLSKWANDKRPDFDVIYDLLLEQIRFAQGGPAIYEGPYDPRWVPEGFVTQ
jgi:hypothetical protein